MGSMGSLWQGFVEKPGVSGKGYFDEFAHYNASSLSSCLSQTEALHMGKESFEEARRFVMTLHVRVQCCTSITHVASTVLRLCLIVE